MIEIILYILIFFLIAIWVAWEISFAKKDYYVSSILTLAEIITSILIMLFTWLAA